MNRETEMKDNPTPGPDIYRVMLQEPGRIFDRKFVQLGEYQKQSDLLRECLDALELMLMCDEQSCCTKCKFNEECGPGITIPNVKAKAILAKRKGESHG